MTISFATVQKYLTGLANLNGLIAGSPHKAFWLVPYDQFIVSGLSPAPSDVGPFVQRGK
jgi:hypothetical protein